MPRLSELGMACCNLSRLLLPPALLCRKPSSSNFRKGPRKNTEYSVHVVRRLCFSFWTVTNALCPSNLEKAGPHKESEAGPGRCGAVL